MKSCCKNLRWRKVVFVGKLFWFRRFYYVMFIILEVSYYNASRASSPV